jgi:peptidoglycan/xylan/chitin deacetylase (PgdA/CDA1 family)
VFEEQIRYLSDHGYRSVSIKEAFRLAQAPVRGEKPVAITFDDGYRDFYTNAFPILHRYGYSATVFLPTAYIGNEPRRFQDEECLTWEEARELRRAGVDFGSHTVTHPQLHHVTPEQLREEIGYSKDQMESRLGDPVDTFSYPYAFPEADRTFVGRLSGLLEECGYQRGVSTVVGRAGRTDSRFFMKRLPVNSHDDRWLFQAKLEGAYDWLHPVQYTAKLIRSKPAFGRRQD